VAIIDRGHPVRLSAKRKQPLNKVPMQLSVLRTLTDRDVRAPSTLSIQLRLTNLLFLFSAKLVQLLS
jgi:hypothetical protein